MAYNHPFRLRESHLLIKTQETGDTIDICASNSSTVYENRLTATIDSILSDWGIQLAFTVKVRLWCKRHCSRKRSLFSMAQLFATLCRSPLKSFARFITIAYASRWVRSIRTRLRNATNRRRWAGEKVRAEFLFGAINLVGQSARTISNVRAFINARKT